MSYCRMELMQDCCRGYPGDHGGLEGGLVLGVLVDDVHVRPHRVPA